MIRSTSLLLLASITSAPLTAQADVYWQASRTSQELHRINACGELDFKVDLSTNTFPGTTAPQLRSAHLAPDGQVWVVNFIQSHFTLLDGDGTNIRNIPVVSGGRPYDIQFDKAGNAYISMTGTSGVEMYSSKGVLIKSFPMVGGNPLGMSVDSDGNLWVAHRLTPPSKVTKIDIAAGTMKDFPFPNATASMGGQVVADFQGLLQKSTVWCLGDSSSDLIHFDNAGNHLGTYQIDPTSTTISAMTIDSKNNIWIGNFRNSNIFYFDTTQLKVVQTVQCSPNCLGLAIDSRGRLLATARVSFSGPQPSVVRRFNTTTFAEEQVTEVGIGAGSAASSNFHYALVVDPFGDADNDGGANFDEVQNFTAPFDAQSNRDHNLIVEGPNSQGGKLAIGVQGKAGSKAVVGIGLSKLPAPVCLSPWKGCLLLDPSTLAATLAVTVPATLNETVPNNPVFVGLAVRLQALYDIGGPLPSWSNLDCVYIYQ